MVALLAAILAGFALVPAVQTWIARTALSDANMKGKVGSLSAGFGRVDVADLEIDVDGGVLKVPSLTARLPLVAALWNRRANVSHLETMGWTLNLTRPTSPENGSPEPSPVQDAGSPETPASREKPAFQGVAESLAGLLSRGTLPFQVSLDGVETEGDVFVTITGQKEPTQVHVVIKGGGLAPGREGSFSLDATAVLADSEFAAEAIEAHGRIVVGMSARGALERVKVDAGLSDTSGRIPKGQALSVEIARGHGPNDEDITLDLARGSQRLANVVAHFRGTPRSLSGSWSLNLSDTDLAIFPQARSLPKFSASGDGGFDTDPALDRVHVEGRMSGSAGHLGIIAPALEPMGTLAVDATFDAVHETHTLRVDSLRAAIGGPTPIAQVEFVQAFSLDEDSGRVAAADPVKDLLDLSFRDFPLALLAGLTGPIAFTRGSATGSFAVRAGAQGITLASKAPLRAEAVSFSRMGAPVASDLDLSLSTKAIWANHSLAVELGPLELGSRGRSLATIRAKVSRPDAADQPVTVAGAWDADLDALSASQAVPGLAGMTARSASGDFSANIGPTTKVEGKLSLAGHDPAHKVDATVHAEIFGDGTVEFRFPATIAVGPVPSDVSLDGTWTPGDTGAQVGVELSGGLVSMEHLKFMAAQLGLMGGGRSPLGAPGSSGATARDRIPFWGDRTGSVMIVIDRLTGADGEFKDVRGTIEVERGSIHLKKGRCSLPHHTLENAEGSLSFDADADRPYSLKATAAAFEVDAAALFNPPPSGQDPAVEGHFSVASTLSGEGMNLWDLVGHARVEYRLKSSGGIVRVLRTDVADAIPETATPVADTLGTVGTAVGSIFGLKSDLGSKNPVSKTAEAVMQFTNNVSEIGFDVASLTAVRESDLSIRLSDISMKGPDVRLTGSGQITGAKGVALRDQPLSLDLQVWVRGKLAEFLATADLLSAQKDADGFARLAQPVHFGGTLHSIDQSQWHDLLAKAATKNPPKGPKNK